MHPVSSMPRLIRCSRLPVLLLALIALNGCSSSGNRDFTGTSSSRGANPADRIQACKSTDRLIASPAQCLQDDAACYEITGGQWCTGPRGNACPEGSTAVTPGSECPAGARCFQVSESLECKI